MDLTSSPSGIKLSTLPAAAIRRSRRPLYVGLVLAFVIGLLLLGGFLARFLGPSTVEQGATNQQEVFPDTTGETDGGQSGEQVLRELGLDGATAKPQPPATAAQTAGAGQVPAPTPIQSPPGTRSINGLTNRASLHRAPRRPGHNNQQVFHVKRLRSRPKNKSGLTPTTANTKHCTSR
jgi:hypothetical protein